VSASIDWVSRWRDLVEARRDQGRRLDTQHRRSDAWGGGRARRFAQHVAAGGTRDPLLDRLLAIVDADTTVLDVGAGPGRHTIPLARVARRVTAVEPSEGMRESLRENVAAAGLTNVEVIGAEWPLPPDLQTPTADLVVCSHVLYPVVEVEPFLRALNAAAERAVYLVMRIGQREEPYLDLFAQLLGEPRALSPTALDLFNVAHQLGFPASFDVVPFPSWRSFESRDDAVAQVRAELLNPADPAVDEPIRAFLSERLVERDGALGLIADQPRAGVVWWEAQPLV
jgi:SAM-dependent methyltransferase